MEIALLTEKAVFVKALAAWNLMESQLTHLKASFCFSIYISSYKTFMSCSRKKYCQV